MTRFRMALWRLRAIFKRNALDRQFSDEIQSHIEMLTADNVRAGMSPEDARQAAVRAFGGVEQVKEMHRDIRAFPWIEQTWSDIGFSIRSLAKNPAFTLFAALTLAVGVGMNTTVFDIYNAIARKPIAVADPDHVVRFKRWFESHRLGPGQHYFSYAEYGYVRDHSDDLFSDVIAASRPVSPNVVLPPTAVQLSRRSGRLVG